MKIKILYEEARPPPNLPHFEKQKWGRRERTECILESKIASGKMNDVGATLQNISNSFQTKMYCKDCVISGKERVALD
jgi:hypothetical protein